MLKNYSRRDGESRSRTTFNLHVLHAALSSCQPDACPACVQSAWCPLHRQKRQEEGVFQASLTPVNLSACKLPKDGRMMPREHCLSADWIPQAAQASHLAACTLCGTSTVMLKEHYPSAT
eukprot:1159043-Pelagomonas_calceolata.AAC.2